jgi:hypothetical protein
MVRRVSTSQDVGFRVKRPALYSLPMSSTMLTKRRAVDHCRVRSSLCRMS